MLWLNRKRFFLIRSIFYFYQAKNHTNENRFHCFFTFTVIDHAFL